MQFDDTAKGIILGVFAFILVFSAIPAPIARAANAPYFSMTLIAPTSNPVRRQWAQIIQNSFTSAGIDAHLVYMSFGQWLGLLNGNTTCPAGTTSPISGSDNCPEPSFANGGWDAGFVGNGGGTSLPDFSTQAVVFYRGDNPNFYPPNGQNNYWWRNSTYDALAAQYGSTFDPAARLPIAQKMVQIVAQSRPGAVLLYPEQAYPFNPNFKPWGTAGTAVTSTTAGLDWQHWATGSVSTVNVAVTGDLDAVNPYPNAAQNSLYDRYMWGPPVGGTGSQEPDARGTGVYILGTVSSISSDAAHLNYTETLLPGVKFQDGTPVTADDYLFSNMAGVVTATGWVNSGTLISILGNFIEFRYSNGTVDYVNQGVYQHRGPVPAGWTATSVWTSHGANSFSLTVPVPYLFTNPLVTLTNPVPMHLYEQVAFSKWTSTPLSGFTSGCTNGALLSTCSAGGISTNYFSIKYDSVRFGGNGSLTHVYGPIGAGPYIYHGYDAISQTATLTKFPGFWNATGLQGLHQFTINTVHVSHIAAKDAAIAAFGTGAGAISFMDANYQFNHDDINAMNKLGAFVAVVNDPANGWQEMPINDGLPIWGTGTGTPLGQSTPSKAPFAARMVRTALNLLIPRQSIITNLLQGLASPGITQFFPTQGIVHAGDIYQGISPDPYNQTLALEYLAAAGYNTGYKSPFQGGGLLPTTPITLQNIKLNVPGFFLGNSFTLTGAFPVTPGKGVASWYVTLQQSFDGGKTWAPAALGTASDGGAYSLTFAPANTGNLTYRVFFTGIAASYYNGTAGPLRGVTVPGPSIVESYDFPSTTHACAGGIATRARPCAANSTDTQYSGSTSLNVGTYQGLFGSLAAGLNTAFTSLASQTSSNFNTVNSNIQTLSNQVAQSAKASDLTTLSNQVSTLNSQVSTLTDVAYAALAVAVILGLLAIVVSRRKPS